MKTTITLEFGNKALHDRFMRDFLGLLLQQPHTPGLKVVTKREYNLNDDLAGAKPGAISNDLARLLEALGVEDGAAQPDDTPLERYINSLDHRSDDATG